MTHDRRMLSFLALGLALATSASAQDSPAENLKYVATLTGKCHEFVLDGVDASDRCENVLVNAAYRGSKSSFQFTLKDQAVFGFYGSDTKATGDKATLIVEKMTLNLLLGTPPTNGPATGKCTYTNPYAGPAVVRCTVASNGMNITALFVSDGSEPSIVEL